MSELSAKLAHLKGNKATSEIVSALGVSRETFRRLERGESVKLSTLRQIADYLKVDRAAWVELLAAWLKLEAGADGQALWIEPREQSRSTLTDANNSQIARAMMLFTGLNADERRQIILAMERPEMRRCLAELNRLYDTLSEK